MKYEDFLQSSFLSSANQEYIEAMYAQYIQKNINVDPNWQKYFAEFEVDQKLYFEHKNTLQALKEHNFAKSTNVTQNTLAANNNNDLLYKVLELINNYRKFGHLNAKLDPLSKSLHNLDNQKKLTLEYYQLNNNLSDKVDVIFANTKQNLTLSELFKTLNKIYATSIGVEFSHITNDVEREYLQNLFEEKMLQRTFSRQEQQHLYELLLKADGLEKYLGAKFPGAKRFSIEGCDSLLISLDQIISLCGKYGAKEAVLCMAHRGRLNVMVNTLGKLPGKLFDGFAGKHDHMDISGDVKYHQGFTADAKTPNGDLHLNLCFNPSHLEIVTPVAMGSSKARQQFRQDHTYNQVVCIAIHGDAAFAGQGVIMESMNMALTRGYGIGGTIHIITNNQIGFTTHVALDARSTMYCSDIGKMFEAPILHVNADDAEAVVIVSEIALEYRSKFKKDVIVDLIGYRRLGHNEADEPSVTQPQMYEIINKHPTPVAVYESKLIAAGSFKIEELEANKNLYRSKLDQRTEVVANYIMHMDNNTATQHDWSIYLKQDNLALISTQIDLELLKKLATIRDTVPADFTLHPRLEKIMHDRMKMTNGELPIDWGYAETLAYATLLNDGMHVRLSGQDVGRGTFFHRHIVWHDQHSDKDYISLQHISEHQGNCTVVNSLLSEEAVLSFEYGYSITCPKTLTIWEAQFGDFMNGAQVVIDQFISSGEQKWGRLSGLVLLLPHGYEGQGPEHSSARLERFLQLCAENNMSVCVPSNAAQVFHMLRRHMLRPVRKPLIVISPKSLLRHKHASCSLQDLSVGGFYTVLDDNNVTKGNVKRIVLCSGKVYYDLIAEYEKISTEKAELIANNAVALIRIEQLYPFPTTELTTVLQQYSKVETVVWCQEEPHNQGAWLLIKDNLQKCVPNDKTVVYAGRDANAAPATGFADVHIEQQLKLIEQALGIVA